MELRDRTQEHIEDLGRYWFNQILPKTKRDQRVFSRNRESSIRVFLRSLPPAQIMDFMDTALGRIPTYFIEHDERAWKYFCGMCWKQIKKED